MKTIKEKIEQSNNIFFDIIENPYLEDIKNILTKADQIVFSGVGKNWYICEKVTKTWLSMGLQCQALDCVHALHGDLGMLQNNLTTVIFFISKSGTTEELVKLVKIIKDLRNKNILSNITLIGFNLNKDSENLYDFNLCPTVIPYSEVCEFDKRNLVPSLSINTMQMVLDYLGVQLFELNSTLVENYKYNHLSGANGKRLGGDKIINDIL